MAHQQAPMYGQAPGQQQYPAMGGPMAFPMMGMPPMPAMPAHLASMTPQQMQQQMAMMQQQMMAMQQQFHQQQAAVGQTGQAGPAFPAMGLMPGMMPNMPNMFALMPHMQQQQQQPQQNTTTPNQAAPAAAPPTSPAPAASPPSVAPQMAAVPPPSGMATMQMPMAMPGMPMMPPMMFHAPPVAPVEPQWVVSQAAPAAAPVAAAPVATAPKMDIFSDLSNPSLALKKERFVIEQTVKKSVPPPSAGVRACDEEEEEFADFASADQPIPDDFSFDAPVSAQAAAPPLGHSAHNELSFDSDSTAIAAADSAPVPVSAPVPAPLPQSALSADALMSRAFDMFEHKQSAPLVAHASMSQIASHAPAKAPPAASAATHKARRDMPQDLDDLLSDLVGSDNSAPQVELPALGNIPVPAAAVAQGSVVENEDEDEDDEGFGDFTSTAATSAPLPADVLHVQQTQDAHVPQPAPTSSFAMPTSSFSLPSYSFAPPVAALPLVPTPVAPIAAAAGEDDEEDFGTFSSADGGESAPEKDEFAFASGNMATGPAAAPAITLPAVAVEEAGDDEDFADFSSSGPPAPAEAVSSESSDPFGDLATEPTSDPALPSLTPALDAPLQTASAPVAVAATTVEDEDEDDEEEFADFASSSAPAQAHPQSEPVALLEDEDDEEFTFTSATTATAPVDFVVTAASETALQASPPEAEVEAEPAKPKQEADLIGDWGTAVTSKKANPFAVAAEEAAPTIATLSPSPVVAEPPPSFDDVFGSLIESDSSSAAALPDLPPLTFEPAPVVSASRASISLAHPPAATAFAATPLTPTGVDDDEDDDFGTFASSGNEDATTSLSFAPSPSLDLQSTPPPLAAAAAPSLAPFAFSAAAAVLTLPSELIVHSVVPLDLALVPRDAAAEVAPSTVDEAYAMLVRQERFHEAQLCAAQQGVASELATLTASYKAALAAAEEDESDDGAQLAAAMSLQKQIKALKAQKANPAWMRPELAAEEAAQAPATWSQIQRTLIGLDAEWEAFFASLYPEPFAEVAAAKDLAAALALQQEANTLLRQVLALAVREDPSAHSRRLGQALDFIQTQLAVGDSFVQETSQLDLSSPSHGGEYAALLSAPSSGTASFLSGLSSLYRLLLRIEFSTRLFGLALPSDVLDRSHKHWLSILQHAHSHPLQPHLATWLTAHVVDVDAERQRMNSENSVESLSAHRGRHTCRVCLGNQPRAGVHPDCAALEAHLRA